MLQFVAQVEEGGGFVVCGRRMDRGIGAAMYSEERDPNGKRRTVTGEVVYVNARGPVDGDPSPMVASWSKVMDCAPAA